MSLRFHERSRAATGAGPCPPRSPEAAPPLPAAPRAPPRPPGGGAAPAHWAEVGAGRALRWVTSPARPTGGAGREPRPQPPWPVPCWGGSESGRRRRRPGRSPSLFPPAGAGAGFPATAACETPGAGGAAAAAGGGGTERPGGGSGLRWRTRRSVTSKWCVASGPSTSPKWPEATSTSLSSRAKTPSWSRWGAAPVGRGGKRRWGGRQGGRGVRGRRGQAPRGWARCEAGGLGSARGRGRLLGKGSGLLGDRGKGERGQGRLRAGWAGLGMEAVAAEGRGAVGTGRWGLVGGPVTKAPAKGPVPRCGVRASPAVSAGRALPGPCVWLYRHAWELPPRNCLRRALGNERERHCRLQRISAQDLSSADSFFSVVVKSE